MNKRLIFSWLGLIATLAWISTSLFVVDQTEKAVVTRFGKALEPVRTPGLNAKYPWPIDRVYKIDNRHLTIAVDPLELLTNDMKSVLIEGFMIWRVTDPIRFVETVKNRLTAEQRLKDLYIARLGASVGSLSMESFISVGLGKVEFHQVITDIQKNIDDIVTANFGLELQTFYITAVTLPQQNRGSVIARMQAERRSVAARYISEGTEAALLIEAKAAAEHEMILAKAHAEAALILGEADADAMKILAEAYDNDPEFYRFIRSLESYEAIIDKETTLFLESDSKLLSVLIGESENSDLK